VNKIVDKGLKKYSTKHNSTIDKTQIRVYFDGELNVKYEIFVDFHPKESVTFKDILDSKFDLMGFEPLATPVFKQSLSMFAEKFGCKPTDVSVFIFKKKKTGIVVFDKLQHVHTDTLSNHLAELEI
jgi:hypothetical protein